jgi:hypothetical protein
MFRLGGSFLTGRSVSCSPIVRPLKCSTVCPRGPAVARSASLALASAVSYFLGSDACSAPSAPIARRSASSIPCTGCLVNAPRSRWAAVCLGLGRVAAPRPGTCVTAFAALRAGALATERAAWCMRGVGRVTAPSPGTWVTAADDDGPLRICGAYSVGLRLGLAFLICGAYSVGLRLGARVVEPPPGRS